jgi:hypothetical protein
VQIKIKAVAMSILLLLLASSVGAKRTYSENEVISYGKAIDVARLDATLPPQPFEDWLRSSPTRVKIIKWMTSPNCDEKAKEGEVLNELPLCVKLFYERDSVRGTVMITIGTIGKGPSGPPQFKYFVIEPKEAEVDGSQTDNMVLEVSPKLSDFPRLLNEASYTLGHKEVIDYAKALDVSTVDSLLPSQGLDEWLRSGSPHVDTVAWGVNFGCEMKSGVKESADVDLPLCARVFYGRGNVSGACLIKIGTVRKGPSGSPDLQRITVQPRYVETNGAVRTSHKLSELPGLLNEVSTGP